MILRLQAVDFVVAREIERLGVRGSEEDRTVAIVF